ncbi:proline-rich protein 19 [Eleutherodactylus coqui]|uniref:proline-rich protein 19 n=1 Tax=Eleutherodactylus coqui TaxID=57060 RepID=UPI00346254A9
MSGGQGPITISAVPDSRVFSFKDNLVKMHGGSRTLKVKRRKTKKERNSLKFQPRTEISKKTAFSRGELQRNNMGRKMVSRSGMKGVCNTKQVFITENRLTHHKGIFNREIKSVDIGRLVNQTTEVDPSKTGTVHCLVESIRKTPQSQQKLGPTQECENEDVHSLQKEPSPETSIHISEPASCSKQDEEIEEHQSCSRSDGQAYPGSATTTSSCRHQPSPITEIAKNIHNMLNTHSVFPGRNLVSETRQAILEKVRHLHHRNPTPSSVQGEPAYSQIGNVHIHKCHMWDCAGKEGTGIKKTDQKRQKAGQPMQTPPIRFLPLPRDSPAHTFIKMASPEDHPNLQNILHQPVHYGSDYNPHQYQQISSQDPPNMLNMNSSSHYFKLSRQHKEQSHFCKVMNGGRMTSSPLNASSSQVRWRLANDLLTDLSRKCNVPGRNMQHILTYDTGQECVSRPPLNNISPEGLNPSGVRMKQSFSDDNQTSSDIFWGDKHQRSPATKILDTTPAAMKLSYREQSPRRTYSTSNFISHHSVFLRSPVTGNDGSTDVFPLDSFGESGRERKRHLSSWQDTDIGQHCGKFATNAMPKQRYWHESRCHNLWNPPSFPQGKPKHGVHFEEDGDVEWIHHRNWPHRSHIEHHSQPKNMSPQSVQQESSFVPLPCWKSSRKLLISRSSPDTWVYPRMKLY